MKSVISENNPLGIKAIDHLEFTCANVKESPTRALLYTLGFSKTFEDQSSGAELFNQGQCRFLMVSDSHGSSHAAQYFKDHGEGVSKLSFLVEDAELAMKTAIERGAEVVDELTITETEEGVFKRGTIKGFGDVLNELVERPNSHFRPGFTKLENDPDATPLDARTARIDHLTNNVPKGEMDKWVDFYQRIYGFEVTRYFDIKGVKTGLESKVVQSPNGAVIIPINEPEAEGGKSQIQEFLDRHNGAGVQHIALTCGDIVKTIAQLQERGIKFLEIPHTYYEAIPSRGLKVTEDIDELEKCQILVDGDSDGYLLQIFTDTYVGPLFFEFIQRKNNDGFGEGNFQALFDAIELDQMKRGYLE
jgi:4-hydroxyphenylpyruvate dioxygenase